jgi:iron-sulfur cluster repair protein YtfE (RIC family)
MDFKQGIHANLDYAAHPASFLSMVERLKEEHEAMQDQLKEIRTMAGEVYTLEDCTEGMCKLVRLQDRILVLIEDLDRHSEWEERELFPILQSYVNRYMKPSITPSIWVMEKDHDLAKQFVQSYIDGVNGMKAPIDRGFLKEMTSQLIQACLLLLEHFTLEEELVFPLTDQLLTDIDFLFS